MAPFAGVYNASKAAAAAITETLRIELAVFGIRTINLVTGAVKTNFGPNRAVEATLSAGSIYGLAREEAQKVMDNTVVEEGSDATEWAGQVVRELSGGRPGFWIWKGKLAVVVWIAGFFPVGSLDWVMKGISGLGAMEKRIREAVGPGGVAGKDKAV